MTRNYMGEPMEVKGYFNKVFLRLLILFLLCTDESLSSSR